MLQRYLQTLLVIKTCRTKRSKRSLKLMYLECDIAESLSPLDLFLTFHFYRYVLQLLCALSGWGWWWLDRFGNSKHDVWWLKWKQESVAGIIEEAKSRSIPLVQDGVTFHIPRTSLVLNALPCFVFVSNGLLSHVWCTRFWTHMETSASIIIVYSVT
jgi:hypothetical protein